MRKEIFNMTEREITRLRVINHTIDGIITIGEAADLLNLSERQVIRLKEGVLKEGPAFIIHKNRGRKPSHAISDEMKRTIVVLKQSEVYREANFYHFQELLEKHERITVSYPTVHRILSKAGIVSPKRHRKRKVHDRGASLAALSALRSALQNLGHENLGFLMRKDVMDGETLENAVNGIFRPPPLSFKIRSLWRGCPNPLSCSN